MSWQARQQDSLFSRDQFSQDSFVCPQETPVTLMALIAQAEESGNSSASALHLDRKAEKGGREISLLFGEINKIYFF